MVRRAPGARPPAKSQPKQQQQRGKRAAKGGGAGPPPLPLPQATAAYTQAQPAFLTPSDGSGSPAAVLGAALHKMGVLPVLPSLTQPRLPRDNAAQLAHLAALNDFLDKSYELQQRGHQLWVEEQLELQRGAELCILSAPCQVVPPILSPPRPSQHHTPSRALPGGRAPHESPTDALLSPQTASVLFAAAMGGTCLSPAITGAAAAQLLSPSAFGFPSLVLQDQTNYHKRAASQPPCVSPPTFTCHVEAPHVDLQHIQSPRFLPANEPAYGDAGLHQASLGGAAAQAPVCVADVPVSSSLLGTTGTTDTWRASIRSVQPLPHQHNASSGTKTPRIGDLANAAHVLQHAMSPLSPGDLLLSAIGVSENSNDHLALFASYGVQPAHYECDLHADLRVEAGPAKRAKR